MEPPPSSLDSHMPALPERPPIAQAPLSVILLAVGSISEAAESASVWQAHLGTLERPFEMIVVRSAADAEANPVLDEVRRVDLDPELGLGPTLLNALRAAQHPLVVLATADRQFRPQDLQGLLAVIDHVDLAVGCRNVHRAFWLRALGWTFAMVVRIVLGIPPQPGNCTPGATPWRRRWVARWGFAVRLHDPESPFRLGRREALVRVVLQSRGPFAFIEQLAKANHLELMIAEEPVSWAPPSQPLPESDAFAHEAWALFRRPDFGPPELHIPPPPPVLPVENPEVPPTAPASPSS
jgi:hypothetical protein